VKEDLQVHVGQMEVLEERVIQDKPVKEDLQVKPVKLDQ
jgi:hypothetical protein